MVYAFFGIAAIGVAVLVAWWVLGLALKWLRTIVYITGASIFIGSAVVALLAISAVAFGPEDGSESERAADSRQRLVQHMEGIVMSVLDIAYQGFVVMREAFEGLSRRYTALYVVAQRVEALMDNLAPFLNRTRK